MSGDAGGQCKLGMGKVMAWSKMPTGSVSGGLWVCLIAVPMDVMAGLQNLVEFYGRTIYEGCRPRGTAGGRDEKTVAPIAGAVIEVYLPVLFRALSR